MVLVHAPNPYGMTETLFHNDETRWEVFVEQEGKVGSRCYLWATRSPSVVFFLLDPSRSAAVPGAHFAGLQAERATIVCDRYSAYKKLARLSDAIEFAFCWTHVRRDLLNAGRAYPALESRALAWKARIGELYHRNHLRLEHWDGAPALERQSEAFQSTHQALRETLQAMDEEATRLSAKDEQALGKQTRSLPASARKQQRKVCTSVLNHWVGLTRFVDNPRIPLDNNPAENTIRGPVTGRKNDYGSGSLWSAQLAATLFAILKTLALWGVNPRHWLTAYLNVPRTPVRRRSSSRPIFHGRWMRPDSMRLRARLPPGLTIAALDWGPMSVRYCGRDLTPDELTRIRQLIGEDPRRSRAELSRPTCQALDWYKRDGGLKAMSARVAMLRMHRDGLITLPPPRYLALRHGHGLARSY